MWVRRILRITTDSDECLYDAPVTDGAVLDLVGLGLNLDGLDWKSNKPTAEVSSSVGRTGFEHLSLVVIYNRAVIYNSPAETPLYTYDNAAADIGRLVKSNLGPFDRVFLFLAFQPGGRVLRVSEASHKS